MTTKKASTPNEVEVKQTSKRRINKRIASNPLQYSNGLIAYSNFFPNCFVHIADQNRALWGSSAEPLVPYLGWLHEVGTPSDPRDGLPIDGYGWTLDLVALKVESSRVGYATWDNPEGIQSLVELLEEKEALFAFASLKFPDAMAKATRALAEFKIVNNQ